MTELEALNQEILGCTKCDLWRSRVRAVPGEGSPRAKVMFIGEGPGYHEDRQGRPFVGPAGQFLNELLASVGLRRDEVYITNVVKCRPPGNRDPYPEEVEACRPYLDRQLEIIRPKVVVCLGRHSMARFFPGEKISKVHGQARREANTIYVAMYHPAAALHQPALKAVVEEDFRKLPQYIKEAEKLEAQVAAPPSEQQLSLF